MSDHYEKTKEEVEAVKNNELTLEDIAINFINAFRTVVRYWYIPLAFAGLLGYYMYNKAIKAIVTYNADLTLLVNDPNNGLGGGAVSALLGQVGLAGGGGNSDYDLDQIIDISKSKYIIYQSILKKGIVDGVEDFYANHIIRAYNLHKEWEKDTSIRIPIKNFLFTRGDYAKFTPIEHKAALAVYKHILPAIGDQIYIASYSKATSIMKLSVNSVNHDLSLNLVREIYDNLSDFYINRQMDKERQTFNVLRDKRDSIKTVMRAKEYQTAELAQTRRNYIFETDKVEETRAQSEAQIAKQGYLEIQKQYELADFALKSKLPFIQAIDEPYPPLSPKKVSKLKNTALGTAIGFAIGIIFVLFGSTFMNFKTRINTRLKSEKK